MLSWVEHEDFFYNLGALFQSKLSEILLAILFTFLFYFSSNFIVCQTPDSNIFKMLEGGIEISERQVKFYANF